MSAEDKGTGKKEKITIKAEKARLSDEEIQRMVQEAEEFAEQDKAVKAKVDARNQLETYCYSMKSTVEDKAKDKVSAEDKKTVVDAVKEALEWLEENADADADELKDKLKEVRGRQCVQQQPARRRTQRMLGQAHVHARTQRCMHAFADLVPRTAALRACAPALAAGGCVHAHRVQAVCGWRRPRGCWRRGRRR